jgi:hypothetical protein
MSGWDQAKTEGKNLVWRNRKKIGQNNDYLYLPFFLLIILCSKAMNKRLQLNTVVGVLQLEDGWPSDLGMDKNQKSGKTPMRTSFDFRIRIITINVPVVYMEQDVPAIILMRQVQLQRSTASNGPSNGFARIKIIKSKRHI